MIGVLQVQVQAHNPSMPLCPCFAFKGSPSSLRIMGVPRQIGSWKITEVYATFHYPDDEEKTKLAAREGNVYVATVDGCQTVGEVKNGLTISANGIDEDGNAVTGYILGRGDLYVMDGDAIVPDPGTVKNYVKLCDTLPTAPTKGDAYFQNGVLVIYDGTSWVPSFDASALRDKTDLSVYEQTYAPFTFHTIDAYDEPRDVLLVWVPDALPIGGAWIEQDTMFPIGLRYAAGSGKWKAGINGGLWTWDDLLPASEDALVIHAPYTDDTYTRESVYQTV